MDTMSISPSVQPMKHWTQCLQRISGLVVTVDQEMSTHHTYDLREALLACEAGMLAAGKLWCAHYSVSMQQVV